MDSSNHVAPPSDDLSALAWVQEELRKSLDSAHKALHRALKDSSTAAQSDMGARDPGVLRQARQHIHQGMGALELAGLPAGATVLRASEALVQKFIGKPALLDEPSVQAIERASFALLDYITRRINGKTVPALALFPQYEALSTLVGGALPRPTDLWHQDWPTVSLEAPLAPPDTVQPREADGSTIDAFESGLLALLRRNQPEDAVVLADLCASLASGSAQRHAHRESATWMLASGFLEALAGTHVPLTVHAKRVLSSLLRQLRELVRGQSLPSDRLAQELMFFCAQAAGAPAPESSVLARVRRTFGLDRHVPISLSESSLGRFDPTWVAQAVKRVVGAKDGWSAVAAGEDQRLAGLIEQFSLVAESLRKLYQDGDVLADALLRAVQRTVTGGHAPEPALAMEVATSLLYLEASLDDGEFDHPDQKARVDRLAGRIDSVAAGQPAEPLEGWMEDLYRRVSDRQTIGSVVQELRTGLSDAEKQIDVFFRNPTDTAVLVNVPTQLQSMRGVLAVLGLDIAGQATVRMCDDVNHLLVPDASMEQAGQDGVFDRLATNLGALGFLIDMLGVQPNLVKSLFKFDADTGVLAPVMGRHRTVAVPQPLADPIEVVATRAERDHAQSAAAAVAESVTRGEVALEDVSHELHKLAQTSLVQDQAELADSVASAQAAVAAAQASDDVNAQLLAREQVAQVMADFANSVSGADELLPEVEFPEEAQAPLVPTASVHSATTGLEEDDEMRGIFLEEATEVIEDARAAIGQLASDPAELGALTTVRRAFHTLKGSSRMVGLSDYGDAAWACEQLYNAWLAKQTPASDELLGFTGEALEHLSGWTRAIEAKAAQGWHSAPVVHAADTLRLEGRRVPIGGGTVFTAADEQSCSAEGASAQVNDDLAELSLPLVDLGGESGRSDADITQPSPLSEGALPTVDGEPLSLDWGDEGEGDETATQAASLDEEAQAAAPVDEGDVEGGVQDADAAGATDDDQVKVIGPLRISIPLFNIYLNEADEQSRRLCTSLSEWALELHRPLSDDAIALAHSLAGNSATVGYIELSQLARLLEHSLMRAQALGRGARETAELFNTAADEIRHLLHQFAAGFLKVPKDELLQQLEAYDHEASRRLEALSLVGDQNLDDDGQEGRGTGHLRLVHTEEQENDPPETLDLNPAAEPSRGETPNEAPDDADEGADEGAAEHATEGVGEITHPAPLGQAEIVSLDSLPPLEVEAPSAAGVKPVSLIELTDEDDLDAEDAVDADLFPIFEEEALELLPQLAGEVREWLGRPDDRRAPDACMRTLHTFKGGARLAGAMRLGELAHRMETSIEQLSARGGVSRADLEPLQARVDHLVDEFDALRQRDAMRYESHANQTLPPAQAVVPVSLAPHPDEGLETVHQDDVTSSPDGATDALPLAPGLGQEDAAATPAADLPSSSGRAPQAALSPIDWAALATAGRSLTRPAPREAAASTSHGVVRVKPQLLDRLVNQAGEVSIARTRLASQVGQIRGSLTDLTDNLDRLRQHLRDIELQADTQLNTRLEAARAASQQFDPLEFDRYTRFQELTRMMAESVNDVATVQRSLHRNLETAEDQLAAQARLTRDLQDDLLRTRMVEFEGLSDRLYRVVRQAAKETGKQVRLDIVGGAIEVDRGVLERMTGAFEHLLRNCITHGIETPDQRTAGGKDASGLITVSLHHEGNEVSIEFRDDGAGLNLDRIRAKAAEQGLIDERAELPPSEVAQLIFMPGFSTADAVTELAGRGIGMDVVRSEVNAMGGRIETATSSGQGTSFKLVLPLTTAVTKVVMLRCGAVTVAVPTHLIEMVRRARPEEVAQAYQSGSYQFADLVLPFYWLGALLQSSPKGREEGRTLPVVIIRSAQQRIALHVDEVLGNQEVVVKNLGPQLSRLPGLAGMTLLASGAVSLIYNPVALATVYGERAQAFTAQMLHADAQALAGEADGGLHALAQAQGTPVQAPMVLVVDDSLTVRRVTQRLLTREGYRVVLAKDGLDALERLAEEVPAVILSDIEMPRMDGFDLARNIRANADWAGLPIVMISSRIAQKHRDYAVQLGVNHYLGKPYGEEELLALVARYATEHLEAAAAKGV